MRYSIKEGWLNVRGGASLFAPFVAVVTGVHERFGFEREFGMTRHTIDKASGIDEWRGRCQAKEGQVIELGNWEVPPGGQKKRVYVVVKDGKLEKLSQDEVEVHFQGGVIDDGEDMSDCPF